MCLLLLNDCTVSLLRASIRDATLSSFTSHSSVVCGSKKWTLNSILTIIHWALCNYLFRWCLSYSPFSNVRCRKIQVKKKQKNCNVHFPRRIKTHFVQIAVLLFDDLRCKKRKPFFWDIKTQKSLNVWNFAVLWVKMFSISWCYCPDDTVSAVSCPAL